MFCLELWYSVEKYKNNKMQPFSCQLQGTTFSKQNYAMKVVHTRFIFSHQNFKALNMLFSFLQYIYLGFGMEIWLITFWNHVIQISGKWGWQCVCLLQQISGFESRHPSEIINGEHMQSSDLHNTHPSPPPPPQKKKK